jgi:hypothetical protein
MVYIHGGYWRNGDKANVDSKARLFTDSGFVFVSINYRLSPEPIDTQSTTAVRFPIHPQDCASAIKWIFNNISNYQGDTSKVSLIGHSAGAHLVLLLSTNPVFLANEGISLSRIKCTCSLDCGVFDLIEEFQQAGNNILRRAPLLNAFGNNASLYDDASPQFNIQPGKDIPKLHLVHQNTADRVYANNRFSDSLEANGYTDYSLFNANPYDHGTINQALGHPLDSIGETQSVVSFFKTCLAQSVTSSLSPKNSTAYLFYPNPVKERLMLKSNQTQMEGYSILNQLGQLVLKGEYSESGMDVSALKKGIFICLILSKGGSLVRFTFLKE